MSMYLPFPFMVLTLLLTLPMTVFASDFLTRFPWTILASIGPPILYSISRTSHLPRFVDRLLRLPLLTVLGLGVSLNTSLAVISGLFQTGGVFHRTPKFGVQDKKDTWKGSHYVLPRSAVVWGELFLGVYALFSIVLIWKRPFGQAVIPGLLLYALGYLFVAGLSLVQGWQQSHARRKNPAKPATDEQTVTPYS